jgi:hypothetical protein
MANHFWDGLFPARTACGGHEGSVVPSVSDEEWAGVSCPYCLDQQPSTDERPHFERALDEVLAEVRELMIDRHKKYGPGNISRHGLLGIRVRMDDKAERIDNSTADHDDESYRDAWLDFVGYSLIGVLYLDGKWPGSVANKASKA